MATSLRDIPGAKRAPKRRRADKALWAPARSTTIDMTPGSLSMGRISRRSGRGGPRVDLFVLVLVLGAVGVIVWIGLAFWNATRVDVAATGIDDGRALTPEDASDLDIRIQFANTAELYRADLRVDGIDVLEDVDLPEDATSVQVSPEELVSSEVVEGALLEGEHRIELSVSRPFLGDSSFGWSYVVDSVAPTLDVPPALDPVPIAEPVTISGAVEDDVELFLGDDPVDNDGGRFAVDFDTPPTGALAFTAVDEAGNRTVKHVVVPVSYPAKMQAVHVSSAAWADDELRAGVESLIDRHLVDTVELDLKDESGIVGYDSALEKPNQIGAVAADYDLEETVDHLEGKGVRVIGRIVAFRDPIYSQDAWASGQRDQVIQSAGGGMFSSYGGFTNYSHPDVREYNRSIALEAVSMGVKDILWDYIRRPEGDPATMVVPGLEGPSSEAVTSFLAGMQADLRPLGAYQGASVFGIAAAAGDSIAQDVPAMGAVVDYLAPMVYPSHWGDGMYRVESPIHQPYEITNKSLADFQRVAEETGVRFVPWLQDFTINGVPYGEAEVRAQIQAAKDLGIDRFILWNPNVIYTDAALDPVTPAPDDG